MSARGQGGQQATPVGAREERLAPTSSEALNLWVLNRPQGDLQRPSPSSARPSSEERAAPAPRSLALVVLGFGAPEPCAEQLARRALDVLAAGTEPLRVTAALLEALQRWRWADSGAASFSATLRSSKGHFGGVVSAPGQTLSARALIAAVERHALMDGQHSRSHGAEVGAAGGEPSFVCDAASGQLEAAPGVLLRTSGGEFWGGLVSRDMPADAGLISTVAQYGVSVAVGDAGGILLVSDCATPAPRNLAERVYASSDWLAASSEQSGDERCRSGHALITRDRAWVNSESPLAWNAVEAPAPPPVQAPAPPPPVQAPAPAAPATDAGAGLGRPEDAPAP